MPGMKMRPECSRPPTARQDGAALLEALVAMLILAIGILGLLGVQLRTLADTQTGVHRAQAVRAIEDLAERVKSNPDGFGQLRAGSFNTGWSEAGAADTACSDQPCDAGRLALWDVMQWKRNLAATLPMGRARVFAATAESGDAGNRRQLGVMVGWRKNERGGAATRSTDDAYSAPFRVSFAGIECPDELICHLVYVQP